MILRGVTVGDLPQIVSLNNSNVPAVNAKTLDELEVMLAEAALALGAFDDDDTKLLGFMINFCSGASYQSLNFAWFEERFPEAMYMDRIVVDPATRGQGIGAALYGELFRHVDGVHPMVGIDVNLRPPNEGSIRFHQRLGFVEVGRQDTDGGNKTVSLMAKTFEQHE